MDFYSEKNMKDTIYFGHFINFKDFNEDIDMSESRQIAQSKEQYLTEYSCKFSAGGGLSALLTTVEYDVPKYHNDHILVFFGVYADELPYEKKFYVGVEFDGQPVVNKQVELYIFR